MNTFLMILFMLLCLGSASAFIYFRIAHVGLQGFWGKLIASTLFVVGGMVALMLKDSTKSYMYFVLLGLFLSMIGDVLLELKITYRPHEHQYTIGGICSFALAHICYIIGIMLFAGASKNILVPVFVAVAIGSVIATIILANSHNLGLDFGNESLYASLYTFILCIDFVLATALAFLVPILWIASVGLLLFLVSDVLLSFIYWGNKNTNVMNILNLSFYYVAQVFMMILLFAI